MIISLRLPLSPFLFSPLIFSSLLLLFSLFSHISSFLLPFEFLFSALSLEFFSYRLLVFILCLIIFISPHILLGFCLENNPNESLDSELLIPKDEIFRVRALAIKKFSEDYKKISKEGENK